MFLGVSAKCFASSQFKQCSEIKKNSKTWYQATRSCHLYSLAPNQTPIFQMREIRKSVHHIAAIWKIWIAKFKKLTVLGAFQKPKESHVIDSSVPEGVGMFKLFKRVGEKSCVFTLAQHLFFYWHCRNCVTFCFSCEGARPGGDRRPYTAPFLHPGHFTGCVHCALLPWT